eukprot:gene31234-4644_t
MTNAKKKKPVKAKAAAPKKGEVKRSAGGVPKPCPNCKQ